ncbi:MAG: TatD family hydrolase [Clostridia bacterium]|nr:TatD family hydrolase [Clostridia bacterium]
MWFDSHTHLSDECFDTVRENIIADFEKDNIAGILDLGTNFEDSEKAIKNAEAHKNVYAAVGIHPDFIGKLSGDWQDRLLKLAQSSKKVVAIGEIGLDYHYDVDPRDYQQAKMIEQAEVATAAHLPICIHDRDAHGDVLRIIKENCREISGVLHCFSGSYEMAMEAIKQDFYISIGGPITFKNEKKLKEMAPKLPLDRLLVETDSPCLAPVPVRGTMNVPANVAYTGKVLAECIGMEWERVAEITHNNAKRLFNLEQFD